MKMLPFAGALALVLATAACGDDTPTQPGENPPDAASGTGAQSDQPVYAATGNVTAMSGGDVTIAHGPVEEIGWPAMTMTFRSGSPDMVEGIGVGDAVTFRFREAGGQYELTSLDKAR